MKFFFTQALIDKKWSKIDGTLKKPRRIPSILLHFLLRLLYARFGSGVCGNFNQITPYYLKWISSIFSSKFLQYFKNTFFRTLVYGDFLASSIEKDSLATTRDSFEDCILACKSQNQMHKLREKKISTSNH